MSSKDSKQPSNPPAFAFSMHPDYGYGAAESVSAGMTLRDYFAAKAIGGVLQNECDKDFEQPKYATVLAKMCYAIADAMLAEREKEVSNG